jgi:hypothetical protein
VLAEAADTGADDTEAAAACGAASLADRELGAVGAAGLHAIRPMLTNVNAMNGRDRRVTRMAMLLLLWSAVSLGQLRGGEQRSIV